MNFLSLLLLVALLGIADCHFRKDRRKSRMTWGLAVGAGIILLLASQHIPGISEDTKDIITILSFIYVFYSSLGFAIMEGECRWLKKSGTMIPIDSKERRAHIIFGMSYFAFFFFIGLIPIAYHVNIAYSLVLFFLAAVSGYVAIKKYVPIKLNPQIYDMINKKTYTQQALQSSLLYGLLVLFLYFLNMWLIAEPSEEKSLSFLCNSVLILPMILTILCGSVGIKKGERCAYLCFSSASFIFTIYLFVSFVLFTKESPINSYQFFVYALGIGFLLFLFMVVRVTFKEIRCSP